MSPQGECLVNVCTTQQKKHIYTGTKVEISVSIFKSRKFQVCFVDCQKRYSLVISVGRTDLNRFD